MKLIGLVKKKIKSFWPGILILFLLVVLFLYSQFKPLPEPEEKFVVEEAPVPFETPQTSPETAILKPGKRILLPGTKVAYQTFNNCGPANLAMILSYYGIEKSQKELGDEIRPYQHPTGDNDDKTVFPEEFAAGAERYGLKALVRPNGSLELLKVFLTNEIPVVVKTLLKPTEDSAHFRVVRGFDEEKEVIIVDDSFFGPKKEIGYFRFLEMWQPFNYVYLPVFPKEKEELVELILGQEKDEIVAYWRAINRAKKEAELDPDNVWPIFNLANSYYRVGRYEESSRFFEQIEARLPRRALWYQTEPLLAYKELENYERVFEISQRIFEDGNQAFSELYQLRGEIYLAQNKKEAAKREFELALKYNQNFEPAKKALQNL